MEFSKPLTKVQRANYAIQHNCSPKEVCIMCGKKITVMAFRGTGVCSEICRKDRDGDHKPSVQRF